jgi:hypothetical protein
MIPASILFLLAAPRVFLSYSHQDSPAAELARRQLAAAGCVVWFDSDRIRPGDRWAAAIESAIDQADIVVALLGAPCRVCRDEQARARRKGKRIVPVLLRPEADLPLELEQLRRATIPEIARECQGTRHYAQTQSAARS